MHEKIVPKVESKSLNWSLENLSGNQACSFYKHINELKGCVIPLIFKNLEFNRKVIFIAAGNMNETILSYCSELNNKINTYIQSNQFNLITINASDLKDGKFSSEETVDLIIKECEGIGRFGPPEILIVHDTPYACEHIPDIDQLIGYESILNQRLQNSKYTSLSLFNIEAFGFELLNSIINLYPSCYINSEIYTNPFYTPPKYYTGQDKHFNIFNFKLKKLSQNKNDLLFNQYTEIRKYFHKVVHDLKAPIRTAHITNNMLHEGNRLDLNENKELLSIMSDSLVQAYEQITAFEEMIKTFGSNTTTFDSERPT